MSSIPEGFIHRRPPTAASSLATQGPAILDRWTLAPLLSREELELGTASRERGAELTSIYFDKLMLMLIARVLTDYVTQVRLILFRRRIMSLIFSTCLPDVPSIAVFCVSLRQHFLVMVDIK